MKIAFSAVAAVVVVHYVPWSAPNFDADSHQSYHGWGLVKKHPMQNFRPLEQQEPLSGWPWSFHRNLWQRQNLHNRNIDSNANSIQTSTSPWRRFLLSQRPKILHGIFFYQASTVVRLVRAIVEVWGASWDVVFSLNFRFNKSVVGLIHTFENATLSKII